MRYTSDPLLSEGGLRRLSEDGLVRCSELRAVATLAKPRPAPVRARIPFWTGRRSYTAISPTGFKVQARAEARSTVSQAEADIAALRLARCLAEMRAGAGLIPLAAENGALRVTESGTPRFSEPIPNV